MAINLNVTRANNTEYDAQLLLGVKGDTGKSAYQYAVDGGYEGSETDFLNEMARLTTSADEAAASAEAAQDALDEFVSVTATAETLPAGSDATASYSEGELTLGIPKGDKGDKGDTYDDSAIVARMDSFTQLAEGSTTGDAELIDGRVGADGVTYNNIGGAIRAQVTDLKSDLNDISYDAITSDNMFDGVFGITGGVDSDGSFNTNSNFERSDYKKFKEGTNRTLYSKSSGNYWFAVYTYDANKTPIAAVGNNNPISNDAVYFIVYKQTASTGDYYVGITAFDDDYSFDITRFIDVNGIADNSVLRSKLSRSYQSDTLLMTSGDLNDIKHASNVQVNAGVLNTPNTTYRWYITAQLFPWTAFDSGRFNMLQIAHRIDEPREVYFREYDNDSLYGGFTQWKSLYEYVGGQSSGLDGKKVVLMGDSTYAITGATGKRVANYLAVLGGCTVYDCSFGGTRMSDCRDEQAGGSSADTYKYFDLPRLVDAILDEDFTDQDSHLSDKAAEFTTNLNTLKGIDFSTIDILCLEFGANDFTGNVPLGNGASDKTTYTGALTYCVDALMAEYPNLTIVCESPRYRAWLDSGNAYAFIDDVFTHTNSLSLTTQDYINALEEQSGKMGLPFNENLNHYGWNKYNRSVYFPTTDGAHFNVAGTKYVAKALCANLSMLGKAQSLAN